MYLHSVFNVMRNGRYIVGQQNLAAAFSDEADPVRFIAQSRNDFSKVPLRQGSHCWSEDSPIEATLFWQLDDRVGVSRTQIQIPPNLNAPSHFSALMVVVSWHESIPVLVFAENPNDCTYARYSMTTQLHDNLV